MNDIFDCKLLLVDDEPELRRMVGNILKQSGFRKIIFAEDCSQARLLFTSEKPDVVILDVSLPDGDGFTLMREFRSLSAAPVLFLSARDEDENRLLGLGLGADDYITKPFLPRELILRVSCSVKPYLFPGCFKPEGKTRFSSEEKQRSISTAAQFHQIKGPLHSQPRSMHSLKNCLTTGKRS